MPRLSTLSNPTGIVEVDKHRISLVLDDQSGTPTFSLARLDLAGLNVPPTSGVVVIISRGNTEERHELGPASSWDKGLRALSEIADEGTWQFRVLLAEPGSARLIAAAENVRPQGQGESSSFIALEAADLGQRPWEVLIIELEGRAVIRFNRDVYRSPAEAESDKFFTCMILPEAVRSIAAWVAREPGVLEESAWLPFAQWLALHGITSELDAGDDDERQAEWCNEVVGAFCDRFRFADQLRELRTKTGDE
jgi:hypothetical protein